MLAPFLIALQFLTRLPLPWQVHPQAEDAEKQLGYSVLYYPLVGLLIGGLLIVVETVLAAFADGTEHQLVQAAVVLAVWVGITGALHLDGLADSADAWLGGLGDRQRTLEIMKDPYCGPAGVTAVVVLLLLKFAALTVLLAQSWQMMLVAPVMGRVAVVVLFLTTPYVRKGGIGASQASHLPRQAAWWVTLLSLMLALWWSGGHAVTVLVFTAGVWFWQRRQMVTRIGGTTGDTAGALLELIETAALTGLAIY